MNIILKLKLSDFIQNNNSSEKIRNARNILTNGTKLVLQIGKYDNSICSTINAYSDECIQLIYEIIYRSISGNEDSNKILRHISKDSDVVICNPFDGFNTEFNGKPDYDTYIRNEVSYYDGTYLEVSNYEISDYAKSRANNFLGISNDNDTISNSKVTLDTRSLDERQYDDVCAMVDYARSHGVNKFSNKYYKSIKIAGTPEFKKRDYRNKFQKWIRLGFDVLRIADMFDSNWIGDLIEGIKTKVETVIDEIREIRDTIRTIVHNKLYNLSNLYKRYIPKEPKSRKLIPITVTEYYDSKIIRI